MSPSAHLGLDELLEYYLGELASERAELVETHVFECTVCGDRLDALHRSAAAMVALVRGGEIAGWGTGALANRMARDRLNVRQYVVEPGDTVACTVAAGDDYLMGRFVLPDGEVGLVDMHVFDAAGVQVMRVDDLVIDARSRHAIMLIPARPTHTEPSTLLRYVLVTSSDGGERELARYGLDHTALGEG